MRPLERPHWHSQCHPERRHLRLDGERGDEALEAGEEEAAMGNRDEGTGATVRHRAEGARRVSRGNDRPGSAHVPGDGQAPEATSAAVAVRVRFAFGHFCGRFLRGENIEGRDPPGPPLKRGGGACGRAGGDCAASTSRRALPPVAPLRKGGEGSALANAY